jgi:hypothetical protein
MIPTIYKVRASSWASLFDCSHRFEGEQLLGMRKAAGPRALLGKAFHAGTAAYDSARLRGAPITIDDAAEVVHETVFGPPQDGDDPTDWSSDVLRPREVESIALTLHTMYCADWSHRFEFEAVEQTIKPLDIDCGGGTIVRITGTLDRMRALRTKGGRKLIDLKSGRKAVVRGQAKTQGFRAQLGTYEILYEDTTGLPTTEAPAILGAKTEGEPEIALTDAPGAKALMLGDEHGPGLIEMAAQSFRSGSFLPNPTSPLCSRRFCARWAQCRFHD